jgi:hypothetical protein
MKLRLNHDSCESLSVSQLKTMRRFVDTMLDDNDDENDGDDEDRAAVVRYFQALVHAQCVSACMISGSECVCFVH